MSSDIIDLLAGLTPGSPLAAIRDVRRQAREQAQASYDALFAAQEAEDMSIEERFAVAAFVAALHADAGIAAHYAAALASNLAAAIASEAAAGGTSGPYGDYPAGPLTVENTPGPAYRASYPGLGTRLIAALGHAHMLVFHPRDAAPAALQALLDAGWSTTGIVTLSQLVAFLAFQIRVVTGLRTLSAVGAA